MSVYRVMYAGEWRAVSCMLRGKQRVYYPEQATAIVIEIDGGYDAIEATPGEVFTEWRPELPNESSWKTFD